MPFSNLENSVVETLFGEWAEFLVKAEEYDEPKTHPSQQHSADANRVAALAKAA